MDSSLGSLATASGDSAYGALSKTAAYLLRQEPFAHLWSPASLINETWIRLASNYDHRWVENSCPISLWRRAMRNVLIDHARCQRADKRSWGREVPDAQWRLPSTEPPPEERLHVARALERVRRKSSRVRAVVDLVFVEGVSICHTACLLKTTPRTVSRTIRTVREALRQELLCDPARGDRGSHGRRVRHKLSVG